MEEEKILSEEANEKLKSLPFSLRLAAKYLLECLDTLLKGKCEEEDVVQTFSQINDNANKRYSNEDLMNYDESGRELGFGTTNRNGLKRLLDEHNIQQVVINNHKVGFPRKKIINLKHKLSKF